MEQVADGNDIILLEDGYSMNESREEMDAIPPNKEVPMVQCPLVQQLDISETILENIVSPPTIVTPQLRIQGFCNTGPYSMSLLESVRRKNTKKF